MKQVYFSDKLNRYYDSKDQCAAAEEKYDREHAEAEARKKARTDDANEVAEAYKHYLDLKAEFIKKYGSYHLTLTEKDLPALNDLSIFDIFNKFWF